MPKVSVLMPVYKTPEKYLREAIESILAQTFTDFEFLILDDCPTDEVCEAIVKSYSDSRINYQKNLENLGISGTRNKLLSMAKGEYVAVMDHDDISMPDRFEKQVRFLDTYPEVGVCGARVMHFPKKKYPKDPLDNDTIQETLFFRDCITHPVAMIRKSVLSENPYQAELTPCEDYALWTGLVGKTQFAILPDVLLHYRKHRTNVSRLNKERMFCAASKIRTELRERFPSKWAEIQGRMIKIWSVRLFGFIPLLKIIKRRKKIKVFLFEKIPLFFIGQENEL